MKVEESMSRVTKLLENARLKCEFCEFIAKNANGLNMHKKSKHTNDKGNQSCTKFDFDFKQD